MHAITSLAQPYVIPAGQNTPLGLPALVSLETRART